MTAFVSSIEIDRSPEEVFAYISDPTRFPEWQGDVVSVRLEGDGPPAVGTRFTTVRRIGPREQSMTQEITASSAPHTWSVRGVDGPLRPSSTITIEPLAGGSASRVRFTLDFEGHGVGVPLVPLVRRMAEKAAPASYRMLKNRLEGGGPS
jgi:uncharacterized protein YndB with AHSA1/START domain